MMAESMSGHVFGCCRLIVLAGDIRTIGAMTVFVYQIIVVTVCCAGRIFCRNIGKRGKDDLVSAIISFDLEMMFRNETGLDFQIRVTAINDDRITGSIRGAVIAVAAAVSVNDAVFTGF